jgi:uncharacterized membrane protein
MIFGYKKWFIRGLAAVLPTLITLAILVWLIDFVNNNFGRYIGIGITQGMAWVWPEMFNPTSNEVVAELTKNGIDHTKFSKDEYNKKYSDYWKDMKKAKIDELGRSWPMVLIGFLLALGLVLVVGMFLTSFMGRKLWREAESALMQIPIVKQIYPYVKQVTDYAFGQQKLEFTHVVAVQYPRVGVWSLGFVTGQPIRAIQESEKGDFLTVFMPSSPTPFTGYVITVRREDTLDLPLTIDQALRFVISGGVINPETVLLSADSENSESESSGTK